MSPSTRRRPILRALTLLAVVPACHAPLAHAQDGGAAQEAKVSATSGSTVITITETTKHRVSSEFEIAAGNCWEDDYTDTAGKAQRGLTCGLWVTEPGSGSKRRHVRVHPGQELEAGGHRIKVLAMERQGERGQVRLELTPG